MVLSNKIDNYESIAEEEKLAEIIKGSNLDEKEVALSVITGLDSKKLSKLIDDELRENNNWLTYGDMKKMTFYPFMVQSVIDLISDKLTNDGKDEKKFDENGDENEKGKTLDDWLKEVGGIDNNYGGGTNKLVKMVQKIIGITVDGYAGPEFFANANAILTNSKLDTINVKGYSEKKKYKYSKISSQVAYEKSELGLNIHRITNILDLPTKIPKGHQFRLANYNNGEIVFYDNGRFALNPGTSDEKKGKWKNEGKNEDGLYYDDDSFDKISFIPVADEISDGEPYEYQKSDINYVFFNNDRVKVYKTDPEKFVMKNRKNVLEKINPT